MPFNLGYSQQTLHYFYQRQHGGILQGDDVICARHVNEQQSEIFNLYLQLKVGKITAARFQASGSVALLASLEFVCGYLEGKTRVDALALKS